MVGFLTSIAPIKPKGSPLGFHTLPPCLHIFNLHRQSPRFPTSAFQRPSSSHPPTPIFQWIHGAALTSPSSAWRASSAMVFFVRGPRSRSGYSLARRTCHHRPMAMSSRSRISMSRGLLPQLIDFFEGCCTTTRSSCSTSIPTESSTWRRSSPCVRDS